MDRVAVFVDAGYLFAAGSAAIAGSKQPRHHITIDEKVIIDTLRKLAGECSSLPLLRIYWYDGVTHRGPSAEHQKIAWCKDVKLRLGFVNSNGQQKGVDSLIVTDLIELARNHAMADAVLLAGDEDTRIGVQIAQSYGVRVHILGIAPSRGNQSNQLLQEADTTVEWGRETVETFLKVEVGLSTDIQLDPQPAAATPIQNPMDAHAKLTECARGFLERLSHDDVTFIYESLEKTGSIPSWYDGRLLATTRDAIGRNLEGVEKGILRTRLAAEIRSRSIKR